jgi:hypothetical protein
MALAAIDRYDHPARPYDQARLEFIKSLASRALND